MSGSRWHPPAGGSEAARGAVTSARIRRHYDLCTPFYRLLWGPHIHHGLWRGEESASCAQRQLIEHLADLAGVDACSRVLDVGCGMGGSAIHLARTRGCRVLGLTLSPLQRLWAAAAARWHGVHAVRFVRQDAEAARFDPASFDVLWMVESSEHFFDKPAFFARAGRWLRGGGRLALCAWMDGDSGRDAQVRSVAEGFLCPSFGSMRDYRSWVEAGGLVVQQCQDLTRAVERTWSICEQRVRRTGARLLARLGGADARGFVESFGALGEAYRSGAMAYGCLVARRPAG
jgi:tocopherol O-methyltransferase